MSQLSAGSVHEAAHYICALLNGARIRRVIGSYNSETKISHPGLFRDDFDCQHVFSKAVVMILLSGIAGEAKYTGYTDIEAGAKDIRQIMLSLILKGHESIEHYSHKKVYAEFSADAKAFVDHELRWKMIEKFAAELQRKGELSGRDAFKFVEREVKTWPPQEQLEFWYPADGLGGDMLPIEEHGI